MQAWSRILILLAATVQGLKLTPVHHGMQKIDLSYESHVATTALTNALQKIEDGNLPFHDSKALLETEEIQKLHSVVRRWANMEDRLKGAIAPGSTSQLQLFEDIVHNIASIRVLIGHLLLRADDYQQAKFELELSCPALWKYKSAWRSIDSDGWLDCFASLGELYEREGDIAHLLEIEQKLLQMVPSLQTLLNHFWSAADGHSQKEVQQMSFIKKFIRLGPMRRKQIASEIKRSWLALEKVRDVLQPAVDEFILFGTNRSRLSILLRVQNDIEEIVEHYLQTFKAKSDLANELTSMRVALVKQIRAEAEHYFDIMNLLIDHGEEYVLTLRSAHPLEMAHTPFEALQSAHLAEQAGVPAPAHASPLEETLGYPRSFSSILTEFEHGIEQRKAKEEALFAAVEEKEKAAAAAAQREKERHSQRSQSYSKSKTRGGGGASQSRAESRRSKPSSSASSGANASSSVQRQRTWTTWLVQLGGIVASLLGLAVLCGHYLRRSSPHSHPTHKSLTRPSRLSRPPIASRKVEAKEIPDPSEQGRVYVIKQIVLEDLHFVWVEIVRQFHSVESFVFNWIARLRHQQHDLSLTRTSNVDVLADLGQHHASNSNGKGKMKVTGAKKKSVHLCGGVDTTSIQMESNEESQPSAVQEEIPQEDTVNKTVKRGHGRRKRHKPANHSASSATIPPPAQSPTLELEAIPLQEEPQILPPPVHASLSGTLPDEKVLVAPVEASDGVPTIKPEKPECPSPFDGFQEEKASEEIERNDNLLRPSECFNSRSSSTTTCTSSGVPFPGYSEADYLPDDYLPLDVLEQEEGWIEAPTRHNKHHQTVSQSNQSKSSQLDRNAQAVLRQQAKRKEAESSFSKPHSKMQSGYKKVDKRTHALPSPSSGRNPSVDSTHKHPQVNNPVPPSASKPVVANSSGSSLRGYSAVVAKNLPSPSASASGGGRQDAAPSTVGGKVTSSSMHPSTELVKTGPVLPSTNTTVADEAEISSLSDSGSPGFILPPLPIAADPQQAAAMAHYLANIQQFYYPPQVAAATSGVVSPSALPTVPTMDSGLLVVQPSWLLPSPVAVGHSVFQETSGDVSPTEVSPPPVFFSPLGAIPMTVIPSMVAGAPFNREDIVDMVRKQIEYYFSEANLERDKYLRSIMDQRGFVELSEIAKFRRIVNLQADADMILDAVYDSDLLDVEGWEGGEEEEIAAEEELVMTKLRPRENPERWVMRDQAAVSQDTC